MVPVVEELEKVSLGIVCVAVSGCAICEYPLQVLAYRGFDAVFDFLEHPVDVAVGRQVRSPYPANESFDIAAVLEQRRGGLADPWCVQIGFGKLVFVRSVPAEGVRADVRVLALEGPI